MYKRRDLINLANVLKQASNMPSRKEWYTVASANMALLGQVLIDSDNAIKELAEATPEMQTLESALEKLFKHYADKEKNGKPKMDQSGRYVVTKNRVKLDKEFIEIESAHPIAMEHKSERDDYIRQYLDLEIELQLQMVNSKFLPDGITVNQYEIIRTMVDNTNKPTIYTI